MIYMFNGMGEINNANPAIINLFGFNLGASSSVLTSYSNMFSNMSSNSIILVGDTTAQNWILIASNNRPSSWTTNNVVVPNVSILLSNNGSTTYKNNHNVEIVLSDLLGFQANTQIKYGWSTSNTIEPSEYTTINFNNLAGAKNLSITTTSNNLTGQYYLWVKPLSVCNTSSVCTTSDVISTGTFYLDNIAPIISNAALSGSQLAITASDNLSSISKYYYGYKINTTGATCDGVGYVESTSSYYYFSSLTSGSSYLLCSYVKDGAGNNSLSSSVIYAP